MARRALEHTADTGALMRTVYLILAAFILVVVQSVVSVFVPPSWPTLYLTLPIVIALGTTPETDITRGAAISFVTGYFVDLFSGYAMSLHTFAFVATFMIARGIGTNFFVRGSLYQLTLTFAISLMTGMTILAVFAIFSEPAPFQLERAQPIIVSVVACAALTSLVSPFVFRIVRTIEAMGRTRAISGDGRMSSTPAHSGTDR